MWRALALCSVLLAAPAAAQEALPESASPSPAPDAHDQSVRELFQVMQIRKQGTEMLDMMFTMFKQRIPGIPSALFDEARKSYDSDEFEALQRDIYKRHFTTDEIRGLIAFYRSPVGQKMLEKMPEIMKEGMAVGQEVSRRVLEKLRRDLGSKGYKI